MKHKDVMFAVLSEISGKSVEEIRRNFPVVLNTPQMEKELTDTEAMLLLEELRKEKVGIRKWMEDGMKRAIAKSN
jgi:hypothetical protein